MFVQQESITLSPRFTLVVRLSSSVVDFVEYWRQPHTHSHPGYSPEDWTEASSAALAGVRNVCSGALDSIADIYHLTKQLPTAGDLLRVEPLEIRVDDRQFVTRYPGGVAKAEVIYYLGVKKYRYAEPGIFNAAIR